MRQDHKVITHAVLQKGFAQLKMETEGVLDGPGTRIQLTLHFLGRLGRALRQFP